MNRWIAVAGGLAALLAAALGCSGERLPELTVKVLEANRRTWLEQRIASYDLEGVVTGTGFEQPDTMRLEVREGRVTFAERGGRPMTGTVDDYSVPGLLSTLGRELELAEHPEVVGAPPGYRVYLQARFHPELGYPLHFRRIVGGNNRKVEIRVTRFERR